MVLAQDASQTVNTLTPVGAVQPVSPEAPTDADTQRTLLNPMWHDNSSTLPNTPPRAPAAPRSPWRPTRTLLLRAALILALLVVVGWGAMQALTHIRSGGGATTGAPQGTVLLRDPLTSNAHGWPDDADCSIRQDGYHVVGGIICSAPTGTLADLDVSVQTREVSGPTDHFFGIGLRAGGANLADRYLFGVDANGKWVFGKYANGQFTAIDAIQSTSAIATGLNASNTLEVRAAGTHFNFLINGTQVGTADDATLSAGVVTLEGSPDIEVVFTNAQISVPQRQG
jgi:hypothetical protein